MSLVLPRHERVEPMDWTGKRITSEVLQEAAMRWLKLMAGGAPEEIGIVILVGNVKSGENVLGASPNLSREHVAKIIRDLKESPAVRMQ